MPFALRHIPLAVIVAVLVNVVLLGAYLWSRPGQTLHLRLEVNGERLIASIDGRTTLDEHILPLGGSGIEIQTVGTRGLPSLPSPRGVERVRLVDLASGSTLLEDEFDGSGEVSWDFNGVTVEDGGLLLADSTSTLRLDDLPRDYGIEVTYRNIVAAAVTVRSGPAGFVRYRFVPFRDPSQQVIVAGPDGANRSVISSPIDVDKSETLRGMIAMPLRPYPYALGLSTIVLLLALAFRVTAGRRSWPRYVFHPHAAVVPVAVAALALTTLAVALFLADHYQGRHPNWPDSVAYVFQAKIFASLRLYAPAPPVPAAFEYFQPPLMAIHDDRWSSIFPFGHPLALAPGQLFGAAWIVPPVLGAASLTMLFAYARRIYGLPVAAIAALLLATSPFFLMQASNLMSHNTALFYLLAGLLLIHAGERRLAFLVLAGICFGLLFNTRPLTAAAVAPLFAFEIMSRSLAWRTLRWPPVHVGAFMLGAGLMFLAYLLFNAVTSADLFGNYGQSNSGRLGFGGEHSLSRGLQNEQTEMAYLLLVLNAWPVYVGVIFVLLPFILGTRHRYDWVFLATALLTIGAYTLFLENGVMQGPRMWFEAVPFLMMLTARGFVLAASVAGRIMQPRADHAGHGISAPAAAPYVLSVALVIALVGSGVWSWLLGQRPTWNVLYVPAGPAELRGFNQVDERLPQLVREAGLTRALVLVNPCPHWQCYGTVFWRNAPRIDGPIVYAVTPPDAELRRLFEAFPDRRVYVADYHARYLVPFGADPASTRPDAEAPLASELLTAVPD